MKSASHLLAVTLAAVFGAAQAQESGNADERFVARIDSRFSTFAGSRANLQSLATGLRHGEPVTLTGGGEFATLLSPTRPMGYGEITRSLDLASRELAAVGITEPTPSEISAALNGGSVSTATGDVALKGVLQLRSEGMGWGQIAHTIGAHPGMGSPRTLPAPITGASGITTAAGYAVARPGLGAGPGRKPALVAGRGSAVPGGPSSFDPGLRVAQAQAVPHANGKGPVRF
jgi:hypothetical protein